MAAPPAKRHRAASPDGDEGVELTLTVCASVAGASAPEAAGRPGEAPPLPKAAYVYACPAIRGRAPPAWRANCLGLEFGARAPLSRGGVLVFQGRVGQGGGAGARGDPFMAPRSEGPPRGGNLYAQLSGDGEGRRLRWERVSFRGGAAASWAASDGGGPGPCSYGGGLRFELQRRGAAPDEGLVAEAAVWIFRRAAARASEVLAAPLHLQDWPASLGELWLARFGAAPAGGHGETLRGYWGHDEPLGGEAASGGWRAYVAGAYFEAGGALGPAPPTLKAAASLEAGPARPPPAQPS